MENMQSIPDQHIVGIFEDIHVPIDLKEIVKTVREFVLEEKTEKNGSVEVVSFTLGLDECEELINEHVLQHEASEQLENDGSIQAQCNANIHDELLLEAELALLHIAELRVQGQKTVTIQTYQGAKEKEPWKDIDFIIMSINEISRKSSWEKHTQELAQSDHNR